MIYKSEQEIETTTGKNLVKVKIPRLSHAYQEITVPFGQYCHMSARLLSVSRQVGAHL